MLKLLRDNPEFAQKVHEETMAIVIEESENHLKNAKPGEGEYRE